MTISGSAAAAEPADASSASAAAMSPALQRPCTSTPPQIRVAQAGISQDGGVESSGDSSTGPSARQREPERAAAGRGALDPDAPAVGLDDPAADREPDPRALALAVTREHAEDLRRLLRVDADPVVLHRQ